MDIIHVYTVMEFPSNNFYTKQKDKKSILSTSCDDRSYAGSYRNIVINCFVFPQSLIVEAFVSFEISLREDCPRTGNGQT